jgi:general secretion pathway protein B
LGENAFSDKLLVGGQEKMSYILEALKKSENERSREEIPGLGADHSQYCSVREERKPPILKWVLAFIVLLSGVSCLGWWFFSGKQSVEIIDQPLVALIASSPLSVPAELVEPVSPKVQTVVPAQSDEENGVKDGSVRVSSLVSEPVEAIDHVTVPDQDAMMENVDIPLFEELPEAVRNKIPSLSFAGHVYALERAQRMIMINMRVVREGAMVEPDLILEEIEKDGVILRYVEMTFRINLF